MKVVYTAPNRGHHYRYASLFDKENILYKFISGFSRMSPRSTLLMTGDKLIRADWLQTIYLISLRIKCLAFISSKLAYFAKIEQDIACRKYAKEADIFLFYSGSGLNTCKKVTKKKTITIVEAVNSHADYQEELLKFEYESLNIPWIPFYEREKERRLKEYELADYILLPSEFVKKSFLTFGFPAEKLIKVPYGFEQLSAARLDRLNPVKDHFTILYVGSITVRKGVRYLLKAFEQLQHPKKRLIIVGPMGNPSGIDDVIIPNNVTFTGILKGDELDKMYGCASVFCLPSIEEGLALVLGEAISFGIPVIATENTGASDIICDGKEGYIVPIRDSTSIARVLQMLADDSELYNLIKANVIEKSFKLNGWNETGNLLVDSLWAVYKKHQRSEHD